MLKLERKTLDVNAALDFGSKNVIWRFSCFSAWIWLTDLSDLSDNASDKTAGTGTEAKYFLKHSQSKKVTISKI